MKGDEVNPGEKGNLASGKKILDLGGDHVNHQGKNRQKYMKELEMGNSLLYFHPPPSEASQEEFETATSFLHWCYD